MKEIFLYNKIFKTLYYKYIMIRAGCYETDSVIRSLHYINECLLKSKLERKDVKELNKKLKQLKSGKCKEYLWSSKEKSLLLDLNKVKAHAQIIVAANYYLKALLLSGDKKRTSIFASSLHNYPSHIFNCYFSNMSNKKFFDEPLCFFNKMFDEKVLFEFKDNFYNNSFPMEILVEKRKSIASKLLKWTNLWSYNPMPEKIIFSQDEKMRGLIIPYWKLSLKGLRKKLIIDKTSHFVVIFEKLFYLNEGAIMFYNDISIKEFWSRVDDVDHFAETFEKAKALVIETFKA